MTIEQTVEIPESRRVFLDLPPHLPLGKVRVSIQIHIGDAEEAGGVAPAQENGQTSNGAFRQALCRAYGAWKAKPWENHVGDIRAMREEWDARDPWNPQPAETSRGKAGFQTAGF
ncbi:MAG: hypothetical protein FWG66_00270 [Spirochaetes bacterium]|nr:hypothetical protein [Spirochaetota bacterium]